MGRFACQQMSEVQMNETTENGGDCGRLERRSASCKVGCCCQAPTHPCLWGGGVHAARASVLQEKLEIKFEVLCVSPILNVCKLIQIKHWAKLNAYMSGPPVCGLYLDNEKCSLRPPYSSRLPLIPIPAFSPVQTHRVCGCPWRTERGVRLNDEITPFEDNMGAGRQADSP